MKLTKRKGFNFFRSYYDVYNELQNPEDKLAFIEALLDRQFLGIKPEGLKGMAKFAYISQTNSIDSQVKGYNDKQRALKNPLLGEDYTPTQGGKNTPTEQIQEKEEVKEKVKEQDVQEKKDVFNFRKSLIDSGGDKKLVEDWLKVRKTKKATNTETALEGFINEVLKSKQDINDILKICIERDWKGFKNSWLEKEKSSEKKESASQRLQNNVLNSMQ